MPIVSYCSFGDPKYHQLKTKLGDAGEEMLYLLIVVIFVFLSLSPPIRV